MKAILQAIGLIPKPMTENTSTPSATPETTPAAANVTTDAPAATPEPTPPDREAQRKEGYEEMLSAEGLRELVNECPYETLGKLYAAGDQIRHLVNHRWQKGE